MSTTPLATVDVLNSLLEAEITTIFRFMGEGYPYLNRATAEVKKPLQEMVLTIEPRVLRLAELIERYENALRALKGGDREILSTVRLLLSEHKAQLQVLNRAAAQVSAANASGKTT